MSTLAGISSIIIKNKFPLHYFTSSSISTRFSPSSQTFRTPFPLPKSNLPNDSPKHLGLVVHKTYQCAQDSTEFPGTSPPEFPQTPPPEFPETPNVPDFDPIPPEKPADPPPLSPGENPGPEFPGPPNPSPPTPEAPTPPLSPPEIVPPHGPEIIT